MESTSEHPYLLQSFSNPSSFRPEAGSVVIRGNSIEDRMDHISQWEANSAHVLFINIHEQTRSEFNYVKDGTVRNVKLRSDRELREFWTGLAPSTCYIDLTGFSHQIWAPLVKSCLAAGKSLRVIYVEPEDYSYNVTPTEGEIFDLSERITGVSPIPGFAALQETPESNVCFIPFLGFEGGRFAHMVEQVQPPGDRIIPVVGIPGFRPEFPFNAYLCNRATLLETRSWRNARFAAANNPFSAFFLLKEIALENEDALLKVAPIGTKPHALGAILYAITNKQNVEIVYDHPVRKAKRSSGIAKLLVYNISEFLDT